MKYLKIYGTSILIIIISLFVGMFILTALSYFDLIGDKPMTILKIILTVIAMFISGFITGKNSVSKGWLEGLKTGFIFFLILILTNIIFIKDFNFKLLIYLVILLLPSMLGSMIGILKK